MATWQFQFLIGNIEYVEADRILYDEDTEMFRAVRDAEGVFIAPASNVLCIRRNPQIEGIQPGFVETEQAAADA